MIMYFEVDRVVLYVCKTRGKISAFNKKYNADWCQPIIQPNILSPLILSFPLPLSCLSFTSFTEINPELEEAEGESRRGGGPRAGGTGRGCEKVISPGRYDGDDSGAKGTK